MRKTIENYENIFCFNHLLELQRTSKSVLKRGVLIVSIFALCKIDRPETTVTSTLDKTTDHNFSMPHLNPMKTGSKTEEEIPHKETFSNGSVFKLRPQKRREIRASVSVFAPKIRHSFEIFIYFPIVPA